MSNVRSLCLKRKIFIVLLTVTALDSPAADSGQYSQKKIAQLLMQLDVNDKQITDLVARLYALEARLSLLEQLLRQTRNSSDYVATARLDDTSTISPPPTPERTQTPATAIDTTLPGDTPAKEDMSRALERALIREGGLVLPVGVFELEPRLRYQHRSTQQLELISLSGQSQIATVNRKLDLYQASLAGRIGLPLTMQIEFQTPYASNREQTEVSSSFDHRQYMQGLGNTEISLTKQLAMKPDGSGLLGSVRWSGQGSAENFGSAVATGSSFGSYQASLLFVTRRDPVVLFGGLSYTVNRQRRIEGSIIDPADTMTVRMGSIIALSPDTSLRLGLDISRTSYLRQNAIKIAGSSAQLGEFSTGFSFVLTPRILLGVEAGIGLTPASPDFRIGLSMPIRF